MQKVYFISRRDLFINPAGDTIQIVKTKEYLEQLGVDVHLSPPKDYRPEDLYHLFNVNRPRDILPYLKAIEEARGKIILSPIYWNMEEYLSFSRRDLLKSWKRDAPLRRRLIEKAHLLLPNGYGELEMVLNDLGSEEMRERAIIIPNGVDPLFYHPSPRPFWEKYGIKDFVLSVGRISRRKNQLALIEAAAALSLPLVMIGHVNDPLYYRQCKNRWDKTLFLPHFSQEELAGAYAAAKVHALCSWFDTPGLVSLEAALARCSIVTTDRGTAREYFQNDAFYCQPDDLSSIKRALIAASRRPTAAHLSTKILESFTWEVVAQKTLEAYQRLP